MSREAFHKPKNEEKQTRNNSDLLTEVFPKNAARQEVINLLKKAFDVFPDVVHIYNIVARTSVRNLSCVMYKTH